MFNVVLTLFPPAILLTLLQISDEIGNEDLAWMVVPIIAVVGYLASAVTRRLLERITYALVSVVYFVDYLLENVFNYDSGRNMFYAGLMVLIIYSVWANRARKIWGSNSRAKDSFQHLRKTTR